jgi:hypothetical protein
MKKVKSNIRTISDKQLAKMLGTFRYARQGEVKNEITLVFENGSILQSYRSKVAAKCNGVIYLYGEHSYSKTTNKHVIRYCGMTLPERRKAINEGCVVCVNK